MNSETNVTTKPSDIINLNDESTWPALTGSARQIAWANKLRAAAVSDAVLDLGSYAASGMKEASLVELEQELRREVFRLTTARRWIDGRFGGNDIMAEAFQAFALGLSRRDINEL